MAYASLDHTSRVHVYFANITPEITQRVCEHLRRVPQYVNMRFEPVSAAGSFNQTVYGVSISGDELYHAFYWATLLMRASINHPNWRTVMGLLRSIEPNAGVHWGMKQPHIEAWRRVMLNEDVTSRQMSRISNGPLTTYQLLGH